MMPDAVLLDWEGVLVDTTLARRDAMIAALAAERVPVRAERVADCCRHRGVHDAAVAALAHAGIADPVLAGLVALRAARAFAASLATGFVLRAGAREFVARLQPHSLVAIVSRAGRAETDSVLRLAGLDESVATSACEGEHGEANAWSVALGRLSRRRAVTAERAIALCADESSIAASRDAGLRVIAVSLPAHLALHAHGALADVGNVSAGELATLAGISDVRRSA